MADKDYAIKQLKSLQAEINQRMVGYFCYKEVLLNVDLTKHGEEAFERLREVTERPGKRIRGALAIVGYEMFGGKNHQTALDVAVAMELIQNYLLIVDDVMDRSLTRRGGDTIHVQYTRDLKDKKHKDAVHLGNMFAVNIGILAQHMASDILARLDEDANRILKATSLFHQNIAATGYGQIEDLYCDALQIIDEDAITTVELLKSSYYTFINPLQVGAALAGATDEDLAEMKDFGIPAGIAFQVQDDIIGLFGDAKATGKSAMDDLKEGKITLLVHQVMEHGSNDQIEELKQALGNENVSEAQHARVKEIVEDVGGLDYARTKAQERADEALAVVEGSDWPDDAKRFIAGLLEYIIKRDH